MSNTPAFERLQRSARQILVAQGRSLSVRKIWDIGRKEGTFEDGLDALESLRTALTADEAGRWITTLRAGVFEAAPEAVRTGGRRPRAGAGDAPAPSAPAAAAASTESPAPAPKREPVPPVATRPAAPPRAPAPPPAPEPAPAADDPDDEGDARGRRRRRKTTDLLGDAPLAPLSIDAAVEAVEAGRDPSDSRRRLWDKIKARASTLVGPTESGDTSARSKAARPAVREAPAPTARREASPEAPKVETPPAAPAPPVVAPAPPASRTGDAAHDPRARLKARLAERSGQHPTQPAEMEAPRGEAPEVAPPAPAPPREARSEPSAALPREARSEPSAALPRDARSEPSVAALPAASPPSAAEAPGPHPRRESPYVEPRPSAPTADVLKPAPLRDSPYIEQRQAAPTPIAAPPVERRAPTLPEPAASDDLAAAAEASLSSGTPRTLADLAGAMAGGPAGAAVRAALLAENAKRTQLGLRATFAFRADGTIGLTASALSQRYLELERRVHTSAAEQREIVRRDLVTRVAELSDAAFEQVTLDLLARLGFGSVRVVHRNRGTLLVFGRHEALGGSATAIIVRRAATEIGVETLTALRSALSDLEATHGLILSAGTFSSAAREAAGQTDEAPVTLVDGGGLGRMLYDHDLGVATHAPVLRYVDAAYFDGLG